VRSVMRNSSQVTLLVRVTSDDIAGVVDSGSAWVFRRDAGAWAAEAQLRAANGTAGDFFGTSVARTEPVDAAGAIGAEGGLALCGSIFDAPEGLVKRGSATLFQPHEGRVDRARHACRGRLGGGRRVRRVGRARLGRRAGREPCACGRLQARHGRRR
jgi:hypothetical protein